MLNRPGDCRILSGKGADQLNNGEIKIRGLFIDKDLMLGIKLQHLSMMVSISYALWRFELCLKQLLTLKFVSKTK
jgi:hypothetical protein